MGITVSLHSTLGGVRLDITFCFRHCLCICETSHSYSTVCGTAGSDLFPGLGGFISEPLAARGVLLNWNNLQQRLGLLELGVPRSDGARGTGPAGNLHSPALDPSPGFATVPRGTSCLCSQQHHLKIIILAGIPGLSLQWNVFRIIPKWLCLGLIGSTN